jgi:hypothetical protein
MDTYFIGPSFFVKWLQHHHFGYFEAGLEDGWFHSIAHAFLPISKKKMIWFRLNPPLLFNY